MRDRHHDHLVGAVLLGQRLQPGAHLLAGAERHPPPAARGHGVPLALEVAQRLLDRRHRDQAPGAQLAHGHHRGRRQRPGLVLGVGRQRPRADRHPRRGQTLGVDEFVAVELGDRRSVGVDEVSERVRQAKLAGPDGALLRAAQQPRLGPLGQPGQRLGQPRERVVRRQPVLQVGQQLGQLARKVVRHPLAAVALERVGGHRIGARRAAQRQVDPLGVQARQHAEALGHLERAVVGQHHAAAAHPDPLGGGRDRADQHLGARPRQHGPAVVLGHPVAVVAQPVGQPRQLDGLVERRGACRPLRDGRLVEDAEPERGHCDDVRGRQAPGAWRRIRPARAARLSWLPRAPGRTRSAPAPIRPGRRPPRPPSRRPVSARRRRPAPG